MTSFDCFILLLPMSRQPCVRVGGVQMLLYGNIKQSGYCKWPSEHQKTSTLISYIVGCLKLFCGELSSENEREISWKDTFR